MNLKKGGFSVFLVVLALTSAVLYAESLTQEKILVAARCWLAQNQAFILENSDVVPAKATLLAKPDGTRLPLWLVDLSPKGYLVMSGDDCLPPVVAFNVNSSFSYTAKPLPAMLARQGEIYLAELNAPQTRGKDMATANQARWSGLLEPTRGESIVPATIIREPMLSTSYNQNSPYNDLCPSGSSYDERAITGCVAVAMAQVMKFHEWPVAGKGTLAHKDEDNEDEEEPLTASMYADFSIPYEWGLIADEYDGSEPLERKLAVARLLMDVTVMDEADYGLRDTSAYSHNIGTLLSTYMRYSTAEYGDTRSGFIGEISQSTLYRRIRTDMENGRPAIISFDDEIIGGHSFIVDGLGTSSGQDYYHFNYGWGNLHDGWYLLTDGYGSSVVVSGTTNIQPAPVPVFKPISVEQPSAFTLSWEFPKRLVAEAFSLSVSSGTRAASQVIDSSISGTTRSYNLTGQSGTNTYTLKAKVNGRWQAISEGVTITVKDAPAPIPILTVKGEVTSIGAETVTTAISSNVALAALRISCSRPDILPESGVSITGSGVAYTLSLTPVEGSFGNVLINITATDAVGNTVRKSMLLRVMADEPLVWQKSLREAYTAAVSSGKLILLVTGKDTCMNTNYFRNVVCETPDIKGTLLANYVLWYCNCDDEQSEYYSNDYRRFTSDLGNILPFNAIISPADYSKRLRGHGGPMYQEEARIFLDMSSLYFNQDPEAVYMRGRAYLLEITRIDGDYAIHYRLDSTSPTTDDPIYTEPISMNDDTTVTARTFKDGRAIGDAVSKTYTFWDQVATPTLNVEATDFFAESCIVMATCATPDAIIRYTTNGYIPTEGSPVFPSEGLEINEETVLVVMAFKEGMVESDYTYSKLSPLDRLDEANAIVTGNGVTMFSSTTPWFLGTETYNSAPSAMQSGMIDDDESTALFAKVSGAGEISFFWKASSEKNYDKLSFFIDGEFKKAISGETKWSQEKYTIEGEGEHLLKWVYAKDYEGSGNNDCAWVDDIVWKYLEKQIPLDGIIYTLVNGEATVTGVEDTAITMAVISDTVNDCPVIGVADGAFDGCDNLVYVKTDNAVVKTWFARNLPAVTVIGLDDVANKAPILFAKATLTWEGTVDGYNEEPLEFAIANTKYDSQEAFDEATADGTATIAAYFDIDEAIGTDTVAITVDDSNLADYATVAYADGKLTVTRLANKYTADGTTASFKLIATDGKGEKVEKEIIVSVTPINTAPVIENHDITVSYSVLDDSKKSAVFNMASMGACDYEDAVQKLAEVKLVRSEWAGFLVAEPSFEISDDGKSFTLYFTMDENVEPGAELELFVTAQDDGGLPYQDTSAETSIKIVVSTPRRIVEDGIVYSTDGGNATLVGVEDTGLTSVIIPDKVNDCPVVAVEDDAFDGCDALAYVKTNNEVVKAWFTANLPAVTVIGLDDVANAAPVLFTKATLSWEGAVEGYNEELLEFTVANVKYDSQEAFEAATADDATTIAAYYDIDEAIGADTVAITVDDSNLADYATVAYADGKLTVTRIANKYTADGELPSFKLIATDEKGEKVEQIISVSIAAINTAPVIDAHDLTVFFSTLDGSDRDATFNMVSMGACAYEDAVQKLVEVKLVRCEWEGFLVAEPSFEVNEDGKGFTLNYTMNEGVESGAELELVVTAQDDGGLPYQDTSVETTIKIIVSTPQRVVEDGIVYSTDGGNATLIGVEDYDLTSAVIPDKVDDCPVTAVDNDAFRYCYDLNYIQTDNEVVKEWFRTNLPNVRIVGMDELATLDGIIYQVALGEAMVIGVENDLIISVTIPATVKDCPVTEIGRGAFAFCNRLESVILPNGVVSIGERAFEECYRLSSIILPEGLTSIGDDAFQECVGLTSIILPEGLISIGKSAFLYCDGLTTIALPEGLESIDCGAFEYCQYLISITMPETLSFIGDGALRNCYRLTTITVADGNEHYTSRDGVLYTADMTELICYPEGREDESFTLPATVETIPKKAFDNPNLKEILVEEGNEAFASLDGVLYSADLDTLLRCPSNREAPVLTVPDETSGIAVYAFSGCDKLQGIVIGDNLSWIDSDAFDKYDKNLLYVQTDNVFVREWFENKKNRFENLQVIGMEDEPPELAVYVTEGGLTYRVYQGVATVISVADKNIAVADIQAEVEGVPVTAIGGDVIFSKLPKLTCVNVPASCTAGLAGGIFEDSPLLEAVNVAEGNETYASLDGVLYNATFTTLLYYPNGKKDSSFVIPDGVESIHEDAFYSPVNLITLTIPYSVTDFSGEYPEGNILYCDNLEVVNVADGNEVYASLDGVLYSADYTRLLCYPSGKKDTLFIVPDDVERIEDYAFETVTALKELIIPDSVKSIGETFYYCESLQSITIGKGVEDISDWAFGYNDFLATVYTDNEYVAEWFAANKPKIEVIPLTEPLPFDYEVDDDQATITGLSDAGEGSETLEIPEEIEGIPVTGIAAGAFADNDSLKNVKIPSSVTEIGEGAFANCTALKIVRLPNSLSSLLDGVFARCVSLTYLYIPDSVLALGKTDTRGESDGLFEGCENLATIVIGNGVTSIADNAFEGCNALSTIYTDNEAILPRLFELLGESVNIYPVPPAFRMAIQTEFGFATRAVMPNDELVFGLDVEAASEFAEPNYSLAFTDGETALSTDIRTFAEATTWTVTVILPAGSSITLDWSMSASGEDETYSMPEEYEFTLVRGEESVDMREKNSYMLDNTNGEEASTVTLALTVQRVVEKKPIVTYELYAGWNLIGIPFVLDEASVEKLQRFRPMGYNAEAQCYVNTKLPYAAGSAVWVFVSKTAKMRLGGTPVEAKGVLLHKGWNMVTPLYGEDGSDVANPGTEQAWYWDSTGNKQLLPEESAKPGVGYWIYTETEQVIWNE